MRNQNSFLEKASLFIVLLFHVCGAIGILFSSHKEWFIQNTALNLYLMALLLIVTQKQKNIAFFLFFIVTYIVGFGVEWIGINTNALFGVYKYGTVLGVTKGGVPLLIGINWFIIIFCAGNVSMRLYSWSDKKLAAAGAEVKPAIKLMSFITDGAFMATLFDFLIEPVAVKLGYWRWLGNGGIPLYNYACWFVISAVLLTVVQAFTIQ